ncbi:hypothetical protein NUU61_008294 [Penicillium alfredii]|uniref:Uncharacterized protein n=1 Tax=Penicillium alfredii TaxID=1506179 RepID=A0A9W9JZW9_9EURO|nr:uncharacterized protein NUU61_008294 [Penicillium alfredii]KAJ5086987.1 hypothetical protein NUU61_008294 [Penicillium alfredii]
MLTALSCGFSSPPLHPPVDTALAQTGAPSRSTSGRYHVPATPGYNFANLDYIDMSPATLFFLSNRAKLVQQSNPPR